MTMIKHAMCGIISIILLDKYSTEYARHPNWQYLEGYTDTVYTVWLVIMFDAIKCRRDINRWSMVTVLAIASWRTSENQRLKQKHNACQSFPTCCSVRLIPSIYFCYHSFKLDCFEFLADPKPWDFLLITGQYSCCKFLYLTSLDTKDIHGVL